MERVHAGEAGADHDDVDAVVAHAGAPTTSLRAAAICSTATS